MNIALCGPKRFYKWFELWDFVLTVSGHVVYSACRNSFKEKFIDADKKKIDDIHIARIESSDIVAFLNVFAYLGADTLREYRHVNSLEKQIMFLESWGEGCGVGGMHTEKYQKAAIAHGVTTKSPIKTSGYGYLFNLMPPAGRFRNRLVELVYSFEREHGGSSE